MAALLDLAKLPGGSSGGVSYTPSRNRQSHMYAVLEKANARSIALKRIFLRCGSVSLVISSRSIITDPCQWLLNASSLVGRTVFARQQMGFAAVWLPPWLMTKFEGFHEDEAFTSCQTSKAGLSFKPSTCLDLSLNIDHEIHGAVYGIHRQCRPWITQTSSTYYGTRPLIWTNLFRVKRLFVIPTPSTRDEPHACTAAHALHQVALH